MKAPPLLSHVSFKAGFLAAIKRFPFSLLLRLLRRLLLRLLRRQIRLLLPPVNSTVERVICFVEHPADAGGQTDPELLQAAHV